MKDGSVAVVGARLVPLVGYRAAMALFQRGSKARTVGTPPKLKQSSFLAYDFNSRLASPW